jgi:hypothetical protein
MLLVRAAVLQVRALYNCQNWQCEGDHKADAELLVRVCTAIGSENGRGQNITPATVRPRWVASTSPVLHRHDANVGLRQLTANRRHDQVCAWFEAGCGGISGGIGCRRARAETMVACCAVSIMRQRSDRLIL